MDRVLFLPYELFKENPREFVLRITEFSGSEREMDSALWNEKINRTPSDSNLVLRRRLNRVAHAHRGWINQNTLFYHQHVKLIWPFLKLPKLFDVYLAKKTKKEIDDYVKDAFLESNLELQKLTDIDLVGLGYKTPL
jgi:hypothetical protein